MVLSGPPGVPFSRKYAPTVDPGTPRYPIVFPHLFPHLLTVRRKRAAMPRPKKQPGYFDKRRGLWCVDVGLGYDEFGKRRSKRVTAANRDDLEPKVRALLATVDAGLPVGTRAWSVQQWCEHYVATIAPYSGPDPVKSARTAAWKAATLARYLYPYPIARRRLTGPDALTVADVRTWIRTLEQRPTARLDERGDPVTLSPNTIAGARAALSGALTAAMRDELLARNVAQIAAPPQGAGKPRLDDVLVVDDVDDVDEVDAMLEAAARGIPTYAPGTSTLTGEYRVDRLEALAVLVLALGLRKSESLDLAWSAVDLKRATLAVVDAKTPSGVRTIPLPRFVVEALERHRVEQRAERDRLELPAPIDGGLVFASTTGGRIDDRNALRWWHGLCDRAGVARRRFHAARHTAAVVMRERGVSMEDIAEILGHADPAFTARVYARPTVESLRGAAATLDAAHEQRARRSAAR